MAEALIRVVNTTRYPIGFKMLNGGERSIRPGGFTMLSKDEIENIDTQCRADKRYFATGRLVIAQTDMDTKEELEKVLGVGEDDVEKFMDKSEIESKLKKSNASVLRKWISGIKSPDILFEVAEMAKEMDLPASKVAVIQEYIPYADLVNDAK